ncbi:MAG: glycosyltransferase family 4 protein [Phycisphaerae bacterium]|nr:glycosyltransferase family 4 protein [Phycisphaerae bacterium]
MRVVIFSFRPHYGGAARSDVELAQRLKRHVDVAIVDPDGRCEDYATAVHQAGIDYRVLLPDARSTVIGGRGQSALYRLTRLVLALPRLLAVRSRTARVLGEMQPSVVLCPNFKSAAMIALSPSLRHLPVMLQLRGWYTPDMVPWYGRWLMRKHCAGVLAVSYATRNALHCAGVDPGIIHVLHNPIDMDDMLRRAVLPPAEPLPQAGRAVRMVLPAGIMRAKGQHTAIQALARLLANGFDAVLWIAGDFQAIGKNRPYLEECRRLAENLDVAHRVEWLGLRRDMPQVMQAATVVVLPTHSEGHPRSVLEAMSLAKPLAATPVGGILDMILPEVTGLFFDVDDDAGLAECVERFTRDPVAAERMGRQAQDYIRRRFQVEDQLQRVLKLLTRMSGVPCPQRPMPRKTASDDAAPGLKTDPPYSPGRENAG